MHVLTKMAPYQDEAFCIPYISPFRAVEAFAEGGLKGYLTGTAALGI